MTFPEAVKIIGKGAFNGCVNLESACFFGTAAQWEQVAVAESNEPLTRLEMELDPRTFVSFERVCEATCTHDGRVNYLTADGGSRPEAIAAWGHRYEAGQCAVCGAAYDATEDWVACGACGPTVEWALSLDGTLTVTGTGPMPNYSAMNLPPWYDLRDSVLCIKVADGITRVGGYAFASCQKMERALLADTVNTLGDHAFSDCQQLTALTLSKGLEHIGNSAFFNCRSLPAADLPASVTAVGEYAFFNCVRLTRAVFPEGLRSMGQYAFSQCDSLTAVTLPESLTDMGYYLFELCDRLENVTLPQSMTAVPPYLFRGCTALRQVRLPDRVTVIGSHAFADCTRLVWVWMPHGLTEIGASAFESCNRLSRVLLPGTLETVGDGAFCDCVNLRSACCFGSPEAWGQVDVYGSNQPLTEAEKCYDERVFTDYTVTRDVTCTADGQVWLHTAEAQNAREEHLYALGHLYGSNADGSCWTCTLCGNAVNTPAGTEGYGSCGANLLWSLSADGVLTVWGSGPMEDVGIRTTAPWYDLRQSVKTIVVEQGVTCVGRKAFTYCINACQATLADSVKTIGTEAFSACYDLEQITLPAGLQTVGEQAFAGCRSLTAVTLPQTVTAIGTRAFSGCTVLGNLAFPAGLKAVGDYAFYHCYAMTEAVLPQGLTRLGDYAFDGCKALQKAVLPEGLQYLGIYAFRGCEQLASVNLPDGIAAIGKNTFDGCKALTAVILPESVTSVGSEAFGSCTGLTDAVIPAEDCQIHPNAFWKRSEELTLWGIPGLSVEVYAREKGIRFGSLADCPLIEWTPESRCTVRLSGGESRSFTLPVPSGSTVLLACYDTEGKLLYLRTAVVRQGTAELTAEPGNGSLRLFCADACWRPLCGAEAP